jgi:hypothetical protein
MIPVPGEFIFQAATGNSNNPRQCLKEMRIMAPQRAIEITGTDIMKHLLPMAVIAAFTVALTTVAVRATQE